MQIFYRQSQGFKARMLGRGFHTLIRNVSFPSPTDVESHNPLPWRPVSSLGFDTICNHSSSPLDIVRFSPLHIIVNLTILKSVC